MADTARVCPTRLVIDTPASSDSFGPHASVAAAIGALIESEQGGRALGIVGKWGAGKSTVVELVRRRLATNPHARVFIFDAWAHEGDPLRRAFLERLIAALIDAGWLSKDKWTRLTKQLSGHLKITKTREAYQPTALGALLAVTLFVSPIGIALLNDSFEHWETVSELRVGIAWVLMLAPLTVAVVAAVSAFQNNRASLGPFGLLVRPSTEEVETETLQSPEPTSVEFERWFGEIVADALKEPARRLVVVLDNLDRVAPDTAQAVWTALQTFVGAETSIGEHTRVWFVVPYDRDQIAAATGGVNATGFLAKRMAVQFEVPDPVLSNWKDYLVALLEKVFPDHSIDEFLDVHHIYAAVLPPNRSPTPRDLVQFVNQIGVVHRIWQHRISIQELAYFAALRTISADIVDDLLNGRLPDSRLHGVLGEATEANLAALHFGVDAERAQQLLLRPVILEALRTGDGKALGSLRKRTGFFEVLQGTNVLEVAGQYPAFIPRAFVALEGAGLLSEQEFRRGAFSRHLAAALLRAEAWDPSEPQIAQGLAVAAVSYGDAFAREVAERMGALGRSVKMDAPSLVRWAEGFRQVIVQIRGAGVDLSLCPRACLPAPPALWTTAAQVLADSELKWELPGVVAPVEGYGSVLAALTDRATSEISREHYSPEILGLLLREAADGPWPALWQQLRAKIQASESNDAIKALQVLSTGVELGQGDASRELEETVKTGWLHTHLYAFLRKGRGPNESALLIACIMRVDALFAGPPGIEGAANGFNLLTDFLKAPGGQPTVVGGLLSRAGLANARAFVESAKTDAARWPLAGELLKRAASGADIRSLLSPSDLAHEWHHWRDVLTPSDAMRAVVESLARVGLAGPVIEAAFNPDSADLYRLVGSVVEWKNGFGEWCLEGLTKLSASSWEAAFQTPQGALVSLAVDCSDAGFKMPRAGALPDALLKAARGVARSGELPWAVAEYSTTLLGLAGSSREYVGEGLVGILVDTEGAVASAFYEKFTEAMTASNALTQERRLVAKVLNPIVSTHNSSGLDWIVRVVGADPTLSARLPHVTQLGEAVRTELEKSDLSEAIRDRLLRLASLLKLDVPT